MNRLKTAIALVGKGEGIDVYMKPEKSTHPIPHVHAWYSGYKIRVRIEDAEVFKNENKKIGRDFPYAKFSIVHDWIIENREQLLKVWKDLNSEKGKTFEKIPFKIKKAFYDDDFGESHYVVKAEYLKDYKLKLFFENGEIKVVDFEPIFPERIRKSVWKELEDIEFFKTVKCNEFGIYWKHENWPYEFDPCSDWMYEIGIDWEDWKES
jgi:hypothetical protein